MIVELKELIIVRKSLEKLPTSFLKKIKIKRVTKKIYKIIRKIAKSRARQTYDEVFAIYNEVIKTNF